MQNNPCLADDTFMSAFNENQKVEFEVTTIRNPFVNEGSAHKKIPGLPATYMDKDFLSD